MRYAAQVNRHCINILMDVAEATSCNINNFYNLTMSLATSISFHQLILHIRSVFANISDSFNQEYSLHTSYLLWICKRCCYTYQIPYHLCCTYLFHQMIPYIFTDIYTLTFWLKTSNFYYWLMYPFRIGHAKSPSTKFSPWAFHMETFQLAMTSTPNT